MSLENVKYFDSSMGGAPVLTGQAGSLINVLDACLVNGFNTRTVQSLTRSGSVVTATYATAHGYTVQPVGQWIAISGANEPGYNGEWRILSTPSSTTLTFDIGAATPASPATGTITSKVAALGLLRPFGDTTRAAYRLPPGTTQHYWQVLDDNTGTTQRSANCRGYEVMTAIDTGTGLFPTTAQQAGKGQWIYKSGTQNGTSRRWKIIGDGKGFYLFTYPFDTAAEVSSITFFGEFNTFRSGDAFHTAIFAGAGEQTSTSGSASLPLATYAFSVLSQGRATTQAHYAARSYTQIGSAVLIGKFGDGATATIGSGGMDYPNAVDNGYHIGAVKVIDGVLERGIWPGLYQPLHSPALVDGDVVPDLVGLAGRKVMVFETSAASGRGRPIFDFIGPWR